MGFDNPEWDTTTPNGIRQPLMGFDNPEWDMTTPNGTHRSLTIRSFIYLLLYILINPVFDIETFGDTPIILHVIILSPFNISNCEALINKEIHSKILL